MVLIMNIISITAIKANKQAIIISTYGLNKKVSKVIKVPATKFPSISGKKLCLNDNPKKTAIAVPVQIPVKGSGIETKINNPTMRIFVFTSSALSLDFLAKFSAFCFKTISIFSIILLTNLIFLSKLNIGISKKNIGIQIIDEPIYARVAVVSKPSPYKAPTGIAPFNSTSGNIEIIKVISFPSFVKVWKNFNKISLILLQTIAFNSNILYILTYN